MDWLGEHWQMWATFAIIALAIVSYAGERISMESTSIGVIALLLLLFHFAPVEGPGGNRLDAARLLAGFADPALIAVLSLLVVGQGMIRTGALEGAFRRVPAGRGRTAILTVAATMGAAALLSSVFNNTPVVVIFIPLIAALAHRLGRSVSGLMMPLSFVTILGGMTTVIGSSTNLLVAGSYANMGGGAIGFFDFTLAGLLLAAVGMVYALFVAPLLLPERGDMASTIVGGDGKQYIAQIPVRAGGPLVGRRSTGGMFPSLPDMTIRLVQRGEHAFLPPFEDVELQEGDVVVVAATRATLTKLFSDSPDMLPDDVDSGARDQVLAEVMVAPASRMVGRTLQQFGFHYQTRCIVLGVQRHSRMIRASMDEIRMEAGDVILVLGRERDIRALRASRDVLLLEWSAYDLPAVALAVRARLIFLGVLVAAMSGLVPIAIAGFCGAAAMVASGCLNIHQASRAVDRRVVLLVAAALALGSALQETGGASYLAEALVHGLAGHGPTVLLSAFFLLVAVMTNVISNNATAVLFTPVAVSLAAQLQTDPLPFVYCVVFAANCSFATPIGYQTNLLVMGPGHYRFIDFLRAGGPLVLLIWLAYSLFAPIYYNL